MHVGFHRGKRHLVRTGCLMVALVLVGGLLTGCNLAPDVALGGVVTTSSGVTVGHAHVTVWDGPEHMVAQTTTNPNGHYEIKNTDLSAGTYRVRISFEWYGDGATDFASATPVTVTAGTPERLDMTLAHASDVVGTVVDADGDPAAGTIALALDTGDNLMGLVTTAADGTFDLGIPAGAVVTIELFDPGYGSLATLGGATPTPISPTPGYTYDIGTLTVIAPTQISASNGNHTCAAQSDGTVACWGDNQHGELGHGTTNSHVPLIVDGLDDATAVVTGADHTCALESDHTVTCWGDNYFGQLGDGTTTGSNVPVDVSGLTNVTAITSGADHTCALESDGTVACWGADAYGQLGDSAYDDESSPVEVPHLTDVTAITAGALHTCALKSDDHVVCWGYGTNGQLGDGNGTSSTSPVTVTDLTDATAVTAGAYHTCALKTDQTVACWGRNLHGQLGNSSGNDSHSPVAVSALTNVTAITAGDTHTCALRSDRTVACWGGGGDGQLGNGSTSDSHTPVAVSGLTNVTAITAGARHTCALRTEVLDPAGGLSCWGYNADGQFGNDTSTSSSTPVGIPGLPFAKVVGP